MNVDHYQQAPDGIWHAVSSDHNRQRTAICDAEVWGGSKWPTTEQPPKPYCNKCRALDVPPAGNPKALP